MIPRYHAINVGEDDFNGDWVLFADHSSALSSLQAKHDRLKAALQFMVKSAEEYTVWDEIGKAYYDAKDLLKALAAEVTDEH